MFIKNLLTPLGVPIGAPLKLDKTSDFVAAAGMLNQSIGNAIQAGQNKAGRKQAKEFFYKNLEEQWKALREQERYSSYSNQRQMLADAGYSPYALFNSQHAGVSQSVSGQGSPQLGSSPFDSSAFSSAAAQISQNRLIDEQVDNIKADTIQKAIDNQTRAAENLANIANSKASASKLNNESKGIAIQNAINHASFSAQVERFQLENKLLDAQVMDTMANASLVSVNAMIAQKQYSYMDRIMDKQLELMYEQIMTEKAKQGQLGASAVEAISNANLARARELRESLTPAQAHEAAQAYVDGVKAEADYQRFQARNLQLQNGILGLDFQNYNTDKWFRRGSMLINGAVSGITGYALGRGAFKKSPSQPKFDKSTVNGNRIIWE